MKTFPMIDAIKTAMGIAKTTKQKEALHVTDTETVARLHLHNKFLETLSTRLINILKGRTSVSDWLNETSKDIQNNNAEIEKILKNASNKNSR